MGQYSGLLRASSLANRRFPPLALSLFLTTIDVNATEALAFALATSPLVTHLRVAFQASSPKLFNGWLSGWPFFCSAATDGAVTAGVIVRDLGTIEAFLPDRIVNSRQNGKTSIRGEPTAKGKDKSPMANEALLTFAADIISAHVSHNSVSASDLPVMIQSVYASLAKLGEAQVPVEEKREPAVSIRSSVKPDAVTCLECGAKYKMLKRHLATDHDLTPDKYRARWNLPASYPLVASDYSAKRKELAVKIGLGRKAVPAPAPEPVKAKVPRRKKLAPAFGEAATAVEG